jgi:hypothetical protein
MVARSKADRRFTADRIPVGKAASSHRTTAPETSEIVAGSRSKISSRTGALDS